MDQILAGKSTGTETIHVTSKKYLRLPKFDHQSNRVAIIHLNQSENRAGRDGHVPSRKNPSLLHPWFKCMIAPTRFHYLTVQNASGFI